MSACYHETVYTELNKYVPKVPHGVHFCHDDRKSADTECARVNKYLADKAVKEKSKASAFGSYDF
jgi:hypothetical protein